MGDLVLIVEGKNDKRRLTRLLSPDIDIYCTFGTLNTDKTEQLRKKVRNRQVYLFMDNDSSGSRIRKVLRDMFPDSEQIYTRRGYAGVEGTPDEYLIQQLEKAGLEEYILYPTYPLPDPLQD
ncbi:DNA primase [Paenibacillus swuensis]|uniref:DNA primase n=1 Tax=Paenibacillus swuensis TaxID=1178515 RepID=A0A172TDG5_9BACL|nr:toprim domain-containing protein [Paenibacillus swuensis]ANE45068.1 DNA primase [Paenibacillus swuensis]